MDIKSFKHKISLTVRFNEVDLLGVCNNAVYLNYFEHARLMYVKSLNLFPQKGIFPPGSLFYMVRNEINYKGHARFDDELIIYTKISFIKNSSYGYENLIEKNGEIIVDGLGIVVHVDAKTGKSSTLPQEFVDAVSSFEKDIKIIR